MATITVNGLASLGRRLPRDMLARERRIARAVSKTATAGAAIVRRRVPVAFSELRDSVHATDSGGAIGGSRHAGDSRIVADAPHAAAVENGSRPHWVPLEPLIKWVKLRGMQGLSGRSMKRLSGTTTALHAQRMRALFALSVGADMATPVDAPTQLAKAIQRAIAKHGTKPHHYMLGSLPLVEGVLDGEIKAALEDPAATAA